jgi:methylated-DNA-[protein]-cysteine S-methyltransferase
MTNATILIRSTADGPFGIIADSDGAVLASGWTNSAEALLARIHPSIRPTVLDPIESSAAADALDAYYDGSLTAIDGVPVRQASGPFRLSAWNALRTIAAGEPVTYTKFAELAGRPQAVRAAASACATNAPALFVPCHRVLRTDGTLGGFAWGVEVKRSLLAREAEGLHNRV